MQQQRTDKLSAGTRSRCHPRRRPRTQLEREAAQLAVEALAQAQVRNASKTKDARNA